jgi:dihydroorotate dehydrogenase electron transfer subunit
MKRTGQFKAKIIFNRRVVRDNYLRLALHAPQIAGVASPGQFVNIKVSDRVEPLLRRPFSIHKVRGAYIEVLYEALGKGTELLSKKKAGEYLDIIGPLGTGFVYRAPAQQRSSAPILVAGGMGVAPLLFLAEQIKQCQGVKVSRCQGVVLIGAKNKSQILCEKEFKKLGYSVKISTDDGSRGLKGKVTELLTCLLSAIGPAYRTGRHRLSAIYACGPKPMLKEITRISRKRHVYAQISLEEHMACGIGACLGCAVNTKEGLVRVCKEGPVFAADEIIW